MKKFILKAPFGSVIAPMGAVNEQQLRNYGVQIADVTLQDNFKSDPLEDVIGHFERIGYTIQVLENQD